MDQAIPAALAALFDRTTLPRPSFLLARKRRRLWEIAPAYLCGVIGTCLPMPELRRLARRAALEDAGSAGDYALHRSAVAHARSRNELSRLVHKELDRRFAAEVSRFSAAGGDGGLRAMWKAAFVSGDVAGAFWAVMTHPEASEQTLELASQDLHMLSHQAGASSHADLRRLAELQRENAALREATAAQAARQAQLLAQRDTRIAELEARVAALGGVERRLREMSERLDDEGAVRDNESPRRAEHSTGRAARAEARSRELEQAIEESREQARLSEQALQELLARPEGALAAALPSPRGPLLFGRSVLYVGGRTGMVEHCRAAAERFGGRLLHHDGGQEDAPHRLPPLLAGADFVVCATGTVSHNAYYAVKRACRQAGKPCVLLRQPSLAAFVHALHALSGGPLAAAAGTMLAAKV